MKRSLSYLLFIVLSLSMVLTGCTAAEDDTITASGNLSTLEISIAPELSGRVLEINVQEGDTVSAGDVLFKIDDEILQAQYNQALASVDVAAAAVQAAQAQLESAQLQSDITTQSIRVQEMATRLTAWDAPVPDDYQPIWYYQTGEMISAVQAEVDAANQNLQDETDSLNNVLQNVSSQDFIAAETRVAEAQIALSVAQTTLEQAKLANNEALTDIAQSELDTAQSELDSARLEYGRLLTTSAADDVLRARARVAIAQARYDNARDALIPYQTGDQSLQLQAAAAGLEQAQAALAQAEANLSMAEASVALIELQLERTMITSPVDGVVLSRNLEIGEIVAAGGIVMTVAQLDEISLTVYVPEDRYGQVQLGQLVNIVVDSHPDRVFTGTVINIANSAEYTPRNVQTMEGRTSTVYAVKLSVPNPDHELKPGMPADVTFINP